MAIEKRGVVAGEEVEPEAKQAQDQAQCCKGKGCGEDTLSKLAEAIAEEDAGD